LSVFTKHGIAPKFCADTFFFFSSFFGHASPKKGKKFTYFFPKHIYKQQRMCYNSIKKRMRGTALFPPEPRVKKIFTF